MKVRDEHNPIYYCQSADFLAHLLQDWAIGSSRGGLYALLGEGIFTQDGRPWKHSRDMLRRQFVRMEYQNVKVFDEHINTLIQRLSASEGVVDLQPEFFRFTLATTTALIFGESVSTFKGEEEDTFADNFDYASMISALRIRLVDFHWLCTPSKFKKACGVVKRYANHFVEKALEDKEKRGAEADHGRHAFILDLYEGLNDKALVRDQLVNVLIAGRDTTACLLSWLL